MVKTAENGRRQWKKESGYHRQGRIENTFFRYKRIPGDRLRARQANAQQTEIVIACSILNQMVGSSMRVSRAVEI